MTIVSKYFGIQEHSFPQLKKHRGNKKEKGSYFGPFASASAVNRTLNQLQKVFMLELFRQYFLIVQDPAFSIRLNAVRRVRGAYL